MHIEKRNKILRGEIYYQNADGRVDQSRVKRLLKNTSTCAQTFPSSSSVFTFFDFFALRDTHIPPCRAKFWSSLAPKLVLGEREVLPMNRSQALSLRTSLRLNSPSQETPRGQQGSFFSCLWGRKCHQRWTNRGCNLLKWFTDKSKISMIKLYII